MDMVSSKFRRKVTRIMTLMLTMKKAKFLSVLIAVQFMVLVMYTGYLHGLFPWMINDNNEVVICKFPRLDPFNPLNLKYITTNTPMINCTRDKKRDFPLLFTTDFNTTLIQLRNPNEFGLSNCCWRAFVRRGETNITFATSKCIPIELPKTIIPTMHEFIAVFCKNITLSKSKSLVDIDMFHFIRPPSNLNLQPNFARFQAQGNYKHESNLNVVILGIDAVSHLNFYRKMQKTFKYIKEDLSAIGMNGYTSVADKTFPNTVAFLTGLTAYELSNKCINNMKLEYFDNCHFVWKEFKDLYRYQTSYAEDAPRLGIFNYLKRGFNEPPTDYYLTTLTNQLDKRVGHKNFNNTKYCYGPRSGFSVLLNNMQKMAVQMQRNGLKYFQFTWSSSMTHDNVNDPELGDLDLLNTLRWFTNEGYLQNTIFVLMSDHGIRNYGRIRKTEQGRIEQRMPFLYFIMPNWFKSKYPTAVKNLQENSNKLTSPFDLHETLQDLSDFKLNLADNKIKKRELELKNSWNHKPPRGISLFLPISVNRTCVTAQISPHFCICHRLQRVKNDSSIAKNAAKSLVSYLNNELKNYRRICAKLELDTIRSVMQVRIENANPVGMSQHNGLELVTTIKTKPGGAVFKATTIYNNGSGSWTVPNGLVSRLNLYKNQSYCVNNYNAKLYCFCLAK